jgi:alkylation response protein AidB-like acyl-CoA dehydrogenase
MSDEAIDVETFRTEARRWLRDNLEQRDPHTHGPHLRVVHRNTAEGIAEARDLQRKLYEAGYAGISFPAEYGGRGLTPAHQRVFDEEAAEFAMPDFGVVSGTTMEVCSRTMLVHASSELLRRHIPTILAGEALWVEFFSEPAAGSDLAGIRTRADRDGSRWIINGSKVWSSGAYFAEYGMCLTRTNWDVPKHRGLTWFAVPTNADGVTIRPIKQINGDAEFCEVFFDNVELTDDDLIGQVDDGWAVTQTMLVFEREAAHFFLPAGPDDNGLAADLVELAQKAGKDKDATVRQLVARASINDFAQQQLGLSVEARLRSPQGMDHGIAAYVKLAAGTMVPIRARIGMEIGGRQALMWRPGDVEAMTSSINYLNGRLMSIAGGTNEVQRNGIGERILGLPREPSFDTIRPFCDVIRDAHSWNGKVG